jgi:hypothetical protein
MFLSCLPLHGFCSDGCEESSGHACVIVCPVCSNNVVLPAASFSFIAQPILMSSFLSSYSFSYKNPTRLGFKRPPVLSA